MLARAAIYLDANAGAPLGIAAREAIFPLLCNESVEGTARGASSSTLRLPAASTRSHSFLGNPSSSHFYGRKAHHGLSESRERIAFSFGLGTLASELTFTSSGTESNQTAIRLALEPLLVSGKRPHWILSAVEHEATRQMVDWFEARGGKTSILGVDAHGGPEIDQLASLWRPETALLSIIWVGNETGVITDIAAFAQAAQAKGVPLHLDAAQAWGKIPLNLSQCGAAFVSFSGHKIGALAGTGVLWISRHWTSKNQGSLAAAGFPIPGKQESGRRGGTENLLGAISLGAAAGSLNPGAWQAAISPLRDEMERSVLATIPGSRIHGAGAPRVANTSSFGFEGIEKAGLVMALDLAGFCVSSGSACSSGVTSPSHVLQAMGLSEAQARAAVRVSLSEEIRHEDLSRFVTSLSHSVQKMRSIQ